MNIKEVFKPKKNMTEKEKKELGDTIMNAFDYVNLTFQKGNGEIIAIEFQGKVIFKKKEKANGEKIQKTK